MNNNNLYNALLNTCSISDQASLILKQWIEGHATLNDNKFLIISLNDDGYCNYTFNELYEIAKTKIIIIENPKIQATYLLTIFSPNSYSIDWSLFIADNGDSLVHYNN